MQPVLSDSYVVLDCETTGIDQDDLIVSVSYLKVDNGETVDANSLFLDWTQHYSQEWLDHRLSGVPLQPTITAAGLRNVGIAPRAALCQVLDLIAPSPPRTLVGHAIA